MQQGLKLQQSGNSAKLLLAEAVHRGTMRFESVSQIGDFIRGTEKEHRLDRIIWVFSIQQVAAIPDFKGFSS